MIKKIRAVPKTPSSKVLFFDEMDLTMLDGVNKTKDASGEEIDLGSKMIVLFGPNGVGKSSLLEYLATELSRKCDPILAEKVSPFAMPDPLFEESGFEGITRTYHDRVKKDRLYHAPFPFLDIEYDSRNVTNSEYFNKIDNSKSGRPRRGNEEYSFRQTQYELQYVSEGQSIFYSIMRRLNRYDYPSKPGSNSDEIVILDEIDSGLSIDNIDTVMKKIKSILSKRDDIQIFMSFNNPRVLKHFPCVMSMYSGLPEVLHNDEDMMRVIRENESTFREARMGKDGLPLLYSQLK